MHTQKWKQRRCAGEPLNVIHTSAADGIQPLTASEIKERAPFISQYIVDSVGWTGRDVRIGKVVEAKPAACITSLAAALMASNGAASDIAGFSKQVAEHWLAVDSESRQRLAVACADCAMSGVAESCASVQEQAALCAVQKLSVACSAHSGICNTEALPDLAWDFLGLWDAMMPATTSPSIRSVLHICSEANSLITQVERGNACTWSCTLADALGDAVVTLLANSSKSSDSNGRYLQIMLMSILACAVSGVKRPPSCEHGTQLAGKLLCAAAGSVDDAGAVVLAIVMPEPMGALQHIAAQRQFWEGLGGESHNVAIRPMAAMIAVILRVMVTAACMEEQTPLIRALGHAASSRGRQLWGWSRVGTETITKLCSAYIEMLLSAVDEDSSAGKQCWLMCDEFQWLQHRVAENRLQKHRERTNIEASAFQSSSSSESSSDDGSSEADSSCATGAEEDSAPGSGGCSIRAAALSAAKSEAMSAMRLAAECCGWRWISQDLIDRIVWPAVQKLHAMHSRDAKSLCCSLSSLMDDLLHQVDHMSVGDAGACEYVASTREALQFVT